MHEFFNTKVRSDRIIRVPDPPLHYNARDNPCPLVCQAQAELGEMKKEAESLRAEKEGVLKKLDTLESANERLIDMKVREIIRKSK